MALGLCAILVSFAGLSCAAGAQDSDAIRRSKRMEYIEVKRLIAVVLKHPMVPKPLPALGTEATSIRGTAEAAGGGVVGVAGKEPETEGECVGELQDLQNGLLDVLDRLYRVQRGLDVDAPGPIDARLRYEKLVLALTGMVKERLLAQEDGPEKLRLWIGGEGQSTDRSSWKHFGLTDWKSLEASWGNLIASEVQRRALVMERLGNLMKERDLVEDDLMRSFEAARLQEVQDRAQKLSAQIENLKVRTPTEIEELEDLKTQAEALQSLVDKAVKLANETEKNLPPSAREGLATSAEDSTASDAHWEKWQRQFNVKNPYLARWSTKSLADLTRHAAEAQSKIEALQSRPGNQRYGPDLRRAKANRSTFETEKSRVKREKDQIVANFSDFKDPTLDGFLARSLGSVPSTAYPSKWPEDKDHDADPDGVDKADLRNWVSNWAAGHGTRSQMERAIWQRGRVWRLEGRKQDMALVDVGDHAFLIDRHEMTAGEFRDRLDWLQRKGAPLSRALYRWWTDNRAAVASMADDELISGVPYEVASEFARYAYSTTEGSGLEFSVPTQRQLEAAFGLMAKAGEASAVESRSGAGSPDDAVSPIQQLFVLPRVRSETGLIWGLRSGLAELCWSESRVAPMVMGESDYRPWTELEGGAAEWGRPGADYSGYFCEPRPRAPHLGAPAIGFRLVYTLHPVR